MKRALATIICFMFLSCAGTSNLENDIKPYLDFRVRLHSLFQDAYLAFGKGNVDTAIVLFRALIQVDTIMNQYESYYFLADAYQKVGKTDSSAITWSQGIRRANRLLTRKGACIIDSIRLDSLVSWRAQFPSVPSCLDNQKGFLPFDKPPYVTQGGSVIYSTLGARWAPHINGCFVDLIIDESGNICRAIILQTAGDAVDKSVVESCKKWTFMPGTRKGKIAITEYPFYYDVYMSTSH